MKCSIYCMGLSVVAMLLLAAPGCVPTEGGQAAESTADAQDAAASEGVSSPTADEAFRPPAGTAAGDDPRVAAAASAGDAIAESLAVIHRRLTDLKEAYETKADTEQDLRAAAERMKPLLAAARSDCDAVMRAAKDVRAQLRYAEAGFANAAVSYRQRAEGYADPELKKVTLELADQFDRHAADVPRRIELTDSFIAELVEVQLFLAETDRCLRDTATALAIFSAGNDEEPKASFGGRVFRRRLEQFIAIVFEYQEKLARRPPPGAPATGTPTPGRDATIPGTVQGGSKPAGQPMVVIPEPVSFAASARRAEAAPDPTSRASPPIFPWSEASRPPAIEPLDPLGTGCTFRGELTNPAMQFRTPVSMTIVSRDADSFGAILQYGDGGVIGRRGVGGRISAADRAVTMWTLWYDGNLSPEAVRYDLTLDGATLSGTWQSPTYRGTLRLAP